MKIISKSEYLLAKAVYLNFFIEPAKGTDSDTIEQFIDSHDPQSGSGKRLGKGQLATLKRCERIIKNHEAQNK